MSTQSEMEFDLPKSEKMSIEPKSDDRLYFVLRENSDIVTVSALEKLFNNIEKIPATDLENFVNQYAI